MEITKVKVLKNKGLEINYSEIKILSNQEEYPVKITESSDVPASQELLNSFHELIFHLRFICDQKDESEIECKYVIFKDDGFILGGMKTLMGKMQMNIQTPYISWDVLQSFYGADTHHQVNVILDKISEQTNDYLKGANATENQIHIDYGTEDTRTGTIPGSTGDGNDSGEPIPGQPDKQPENDGESTDPGHAESQEQDGHIASGQVDQDSERPDYLESGSAEDSKELPGIFGGQV